MLVLASGAGKVNTAAAAAAAEGGSRPWRGVRRRGAMLPCTRPVLLNLLHQNEKIKRMWKERSALQKKRGNFTFYPFYEKLCSLIMCNSTDPTQTRRLCKCLTHPMLRAEYHFSPLLDPAPVDLSGLYSIFKLHAARLIYCLMQFLQQLGPWSTYVHDLQKLLE